MKFLVPVIVLLLATHAHALITCEDLYNQGDATDGVKVLETPAGEPFEGYCLQSENGGGWLLVGKQENFASGGWTSYSAANVLLNQTVLQNLDSGTSGTGSIFQYNNPGAIMYVVDDANKPNNWVMTGGFDDYSIASGRYCWKSDYQNNIDLLTTSDGFPYSLWYPLNIVLYSSSGTSGVMFGSTVRFLQVAPQCHEIHCNDASQRHGRYNGVCQNGNAGVGSWFVFTRGSIPPDTPTPQLSVSPSSDPSNAATLTLTINFLQTVTGFVVGDIVTTNAVASNLQGGTNGLYTATLTPTAGIDDTVTVDVPVNVVTEGNEAATQLSFRHDSVLPTATFVIGDQATSPIPISVAWSEDVTSFDINSVSVPADVTVGSFNAVNATHYTFTVAPSTTDAFSVVIPAGEALDHVSNPNAQQSSASISFACDVGSLGNTTDNEPTLDTTASGIYNDEVKVIFTESVKYENTQFFFGSSSCGVNHFTWQESSVDSGTCETTWTGTATWADFTANCDLIRTESAIESVDHIIYQANFHITHTETFDGLRPGDDPITRTITQYMPFEVRLPTSVTATTSPVRIFAPVAVEAAILEQGVSGTPGGDMTGRVGFLTSVQYPFRLGSVTGVTTPAGVATSDADPSTWVGHGQVGTCNDDSAAPCTQFFEWSFSPASGAICELDGEYNVTLEVECQVSQVNDCPLDPNPGSVTLSFTLDTTDFCVELVDDLSVSASLETYLSDDFLVVKHDFIDGQRIYAQAPTQAEVSLSATKVVQVSLIKPDASEIFFLNQGSPALTTEGTQVDLVTVDGAAVGPAQNSLPSFNFLADSELFGIAADQSDFITLKARIELSYDNAGQAKRESRDLEWTVQATTSSGTVATSFAMSGSNAVATQGTGTSASTSSASAATVAGVNVLFMGAALVVMCTVLVAAVVISRGRAKIDALREQLAAKAQA